ncbi:trans-2,3-enoyl-CoA reductase-like isoform X2 [Mobula birostris]|uniref:trans-2,3-enoyl-CoA reductase-like isoform X2 n=1 Tax=Mobula birostris TaxID=1983395 RepID=UPI003B2885CC
MQALYKRRAPTEETMALGKQPGLKSLFSLSQLVLTSGQLGQGVIQKHSRISYLEVEILDARTKKQICILEKMLPSFTIADVKHKFYKIYGPPLKETKVIKSLATSSIITLYFRDLGTQVNWTTVFLTEYIGPLLIYLLFYFRLPHLYDMEDKNYWSRPLVVHLACLCHSLHYIKQILETLFLHNFSDENTALKMMLKFLRSRQQRLMEKRSSVGNKMDEFTALGRHQRTFRECSLMCFTGTGLHEDIPNQNFSMDSFQTVRADESALRAGCAFYWGFTTWMAYYINHPLYTPPSFGNRQIIPALVCFLVCGAGNYFTNAAIIQVHKAGTKNHIVRPTYNPFTWLFKLVSCPNYTYEMGVWISFTVMTQTFPVAVFALMISLQLIMWAQRKHYKYQKDIKNYPSYRTALIPFVL